MSQGVFISYDSSDSSFVQILVTFLLHFFPNTSFFVSSKSIKPGDNWWDIIREELNNSKVILACISRNSITTTWIYFESGYGIGHESTLIPIIIDDLPVSELGAPLSLFQAIRIDDRTDIKALIIKISNILNQQVNDEHLEEEIQLFKKEISPSLETTMGFFVGNNQLDITHGWECYYGDYKTFSVHRGYISIGTSFNDAFQYPPKDSLSAPWHFWGFRIKRFSHVDIYAVLKLIDDSTIKVYVSTKYNRWGFIEDPRDEFRVPLGRIPKKKWQVIIIDLRSLEKEFGSSIKTLIGIRIRGPIHISHIWCVEDLKQIPQKFKESSIIISYPNIVDPDA